MYKIDNINSNFQIIASGVHRGSIVGPVYLIFYSM